MKPLNFISLLFFQIILLGLSMWLFSCSKHSNNSNNNSNHITTCTSCIDSIGFSGCNYAGDYIEYSFGFTGSSISLYNILWNFGDGDTDDHPPFYETHIYSFPGTYTVTLDVNGTTIAKTLNIIPYPIVSSYTAGIAGLRHWNGSGCGSIYELKMGSDTPIVINTSFTIEAMNQGIINLPFYMGTLFNRGMTLNLSSIDTTNKILIFTSCFQSPNSILLQYYYNADSMVYSNNWSATVGHDYEAFTIHSP